MKTLVAIARRLFPLTFLMYVGLHLGKPETGADFVPDFLPFPLFINYLTGGFVLAFIISTQIGLYDRLASLLMALYVLLMALLVHLPRATGQEAVMMGSPEIEMLNVFRNLMVSAALVVYAHYATRDSRLRFGAAKASA